MWRSISYKTDETVGIELLIKICSQRHSVVVAGGGGGGG